MHPAEFRTRFSLDVRSFARLDREAWARDPERAGFPFPADAIEEIEACAVFGPDAPYHAWMLHPDDRVFDALLQAFETRDVTYAADTEIHKLIGHAKHQEQTRLRKANHLWSHRLGQICWLAYRFQTVLHSPDLEPLTTKTPLTRWAEGVTHNVALSALDRVQHPAFDRQVGAGIRTLASRVMPMIAVRPFLLRGIASQSGWGEADRHRIMGLTVEMLGKPQTWIHAPMDLAPEIATWVFGNTDLIPQAHDHHWNVIAGKLRDALARLDTTGLSPQQLAHLDAQITAVIQAMPENRARACYAELAEYRGALSGDKAGQWFLSSIRSRGNRLNLAQHTNSFRAARSLVLAAPDDDELIRSLLDPSRPQAVVAVLQHAPEYYRDLAWKTLLDAIPDPISLSWYRRRGRNEIFRALGGKPVPPAWVLAAVAERSRDEGHTLVEWTMSMKLGAEHIDALLATPLREVLHAWNALALWYLFGHTDLDLPPETDPKVAVTLGSLASAEGLHRLLTDLLSDPDLSTPVAMKAVSLIVHAPDDRRSLITPRVVAPLLTHHDPLVRQNAILYVVPRLAAEAGPVPAHQDAPAREI